MSTIANLKLRPNTTPAHILEKYKTVQKGFSSGKTLDVEFRKEQLRNLYYAIRDNEQLLKDALYQDFHRSQFETSLLELHSIYAEISSAISNLDKWAADESLHGDIRMIAARPVLRRIPYGTVLILSPWNYPYLCSVVPIVSALAAGNTVVLKPTEMTPYATEVLVSVIEKALHPSVFQAVLGTVPESTLLLEQKWDKIMLTGSCGVGKVVAAAAAKHLTPIVLELGGKSPVIVSRKANLRVAAKRLVWGKFTNSGQTCIAPDYVIIDKDIKDKFVVEIIKAIKASYPNLTKETEDYTHIVNERMWERAGRLVSESKGRVELQWGTPDKASKFYPPTVVSDVGIKDSLMQEEIFGPLLPLISVNDVTTDALDIIREYDYPLASYIFTDDSKQADELLSRIRSGAAMINDTVIQGGSTTIPFGGVGNSGVGRYHGKYGFDEFSYARPVLRQPNFLEVALKSRYPPFRDSNLKRLEFLGVPKPWFSRTGRVQRSLVQRVARSRKFHWLIAILVLLFLKARY